MGVDPRSAITRKKDGREEMEKNVAANGSRAEKAGEAQNRTMESRLTQQY
jgi:hypothetical protein